MEESIYFWDDLLQFIEEKSVIPIIGPELLLTEINDEKIHLYKYLARNLAEGLRVPPDLLPEDYTLGHVIYQYLQTPGSRRETMYRRMRSILTQSSFTVPEPLRKIAEIKDFSLYVSTTIDSLMEEAINQARFGGESRTGALVYTFNDAKDLPCEVKDLDRPTVFHLFGRVSSQPDYVLTDEDTLEFIHSLQSETHRPHLLFDELKSHHLLILGNGYSNWLARFFIRTVRNERLTVPGDREAILAGDSVSSDESLVLFLSSPLSYGTKVYESGGAVEFIDELYSRWRELNPEDEEEAPMAPVSVEVEEPGMESGAIFLSYASEDVDIVEKAKFDLEEAGLDVWFDKRRLEPGDDYDLKIKRNVRKCALFCPFISRNTEQRLEGYFRREWRYALDRSLNIDESIPFILPVVIDDTAPYTGRVPEEFKRLQWTSMKGDRLPESFIKRIVQLVRDYRKRERGYL